MYAEEESYLDDGKAWIPTGLWLSLFFGEVSYKKKSQSDPSSLWKSQV